MLSASLENEARRRLLHPQRKQAVLRLPDSIATAAWPASPASASRAGVARAAVADLGQHLGRGDEAVRIFEQRGEDLTIGMAAHQSSICRSSVLICAASVLSVVTRQSTICRRAFISTSPTRPSGARLSLANSRAGFCRRCNAGGPGTPAGASRPATARRGAGVVLQERERDRAVQIGE